MHLTGFTDEVSHDLSIQIAACRHLGWKQIELRTVGEENVVSMPEADFRDSLDKLAEAGIGVSSFGSRIANWGRTLSDPFEVDRDELEAAIPRMERAGTRYLRIMSYRPPRDKPAEDPEVRSEVIARLSLLTERAEDAGIILVHENCETWGGQSLQHTQILLDSISSAAFQLAFDTGNPPWLADMRPGKEGEYQDGLEFYEAVADRVAYIHIKDAVVEVSSDGTRRERFTWPGEGAGRVPEILDALKRNRYDGPIAIEPHMAVVYHDDSVTATEEERWRVFVDYAHQTQTLLRRSGLLQRATN